MMAARRSNVSPGLKSRSTLELQRRCSVDGARPTEGSDYMDEEAQRGR